jgi:hypothetical protein
VDNKRDNEELVGRFVRLEMLKMGLYAALYDNLELYCDNDERYIVVLGYVVCILFQITVKFTKI